MPRTRFRRHGAGDRGMHALDEVQIAGDHRVPIAEARRPWPGASRPRPGRPRRAPGAARPRPAPPRTLSTEQDLVREQLRERPDPRRDHRHAQQAGLHHHHREALVAGGDDQGVDAAQQGPHVPARREEAHPLPHSPLLRPAHQLGGGEQRRVERLQQQVAADLLQVVDQPGDVLQRHQAPRPAEGPAARSRRRTRAALPARWAERAGVGDEAARRGSAAPPPATRRPRRRSPAASAARTRGRRRRGRCGRRGSIPAVRDVGRRSAVGHGVRHAVPEHHVGRAQPRAQLPALAEEGHRRRSAPPAPRGSSPRRRSPGLIEGADVEVDAPRRSPSATSIMAVSPPPRTTWGNTRQRRSLGIGA